MAYYKVYKLNDIINIIIPHFDKYFLITQKQSDFILFKNIVNLINEGKHLNDKALNEIINFKASLNKGVSEKLRAHYLEITKVSRTKNSLPVEIDYN